MKYLFEISKYYMRTYVTSLIFLLPFIALAQPNPEFTNVLLSPTNQSTLVLGEKISIELSLNNSGSVNSDEGYIDISFPKLTSSGDVSQLSVLSKSSDLSQVIVNAGDLVYNASGNQINADYLLLEFYETNWLVSETNTVKFEVTPKAIGTFSIYIRSTLGTNGTYYRYPGAGQGYKDQQGFDNSGYFFTVVEPTNNAPTISITSDPEDGSTITDPTVTFTWSGSDTDGTVVDYEYEFNGISGNTTETAKEFTATEGNNSFKVRAKDNEGLYSEWSEVNFTYTISNTTPQITNVSASPDGNLVTITYDLEDQGSQNLKYNIDLFLSLDSGVSYIKKVNKGLTGDLTEVAVGKDHSITWRVDSLYPDGLETDQARFQLRGITTTVIINGLATVFVEGGVFEMGCTSEQIRCRENEKPVHNVTVSSFYLSKYEITFDQFDAFCEDTGRSKPSDSGFGRGSRPVINVSWNDATAYADWVGGRLPTEAEWEYAARGGSRARSTLYAGSDDIFSVGWVYWNSGSMSHPVGEKASNELGLHDMSGNVQEWCHDWFASYGRDSQTNPTGPSSGSYRVYRGGHWFGNAEPYWRVSIRGYNAPSNTDNTTGFRVVFP